MGLKVKKSNKIKKRRKLTIRRTKEWWRRLSPSERSKLVSLEKAEKRCLNDFGYLPEGCNECSYCSNPFSGVGNLCASCLNEIHILIKKGDKNDS